MAGRRSRDSLVRNLGPEELGEWLASLGILSSAESERDTPIQERLGDGIALCQLVNRVGAGSVDEVRTLASDGEHRIYIRCHWVLLCLCPPDQAQAQEMQWRC